jgi:hypothetical protein
MYESERNQMKQAELKHKLAQYNQVEAEVNHGHVIIHASRPKALTLWLGFGSLLS